MSESFEAAVLEKARGSEFEYVLKRAQQKDPEALGVVKSREFQRRLFAYINRREKSPENLFKLILFKAGAAVAIVLFERVLTTLLTKRGA